MNATLTYQDWDLHDQKNAWTNAVIDESDADLLIAGLFALYQSGQKPLRVKQLICHLGRIGERVEHIPCRFTALIARGAGEYSKSNKEPFLATATKQPEQTYPQGGTPRVTRSSATSR